MKVMKACLLCVFQVMDKTHSGHTDIAIAQLSILAVIIIDEIKMQFSRQ